MQIIWTGFNYLPWDNSNKISFILHRAHVWFCTTGYRLDDVRVYCRDRMHQVQTETQKVFMNTKAIFELLIQRCSTTLSMLCPSSRLVWPTGWILLFSLTALKRWNCSPFNSPSTYSEDQLQSLTWIRNVTLSNIKKQGSMDVKLLSVSAASFI